MKRLVTLFVLVLVLIVLVFTANNAMAQGPGGAQPRAVTDATSTKFTYQGQLKSGGSPINGTCALQFDLYAASGGGSAIGTQTVTGVTVSNGLFTVPLDFGASAFDGNARYLQIGVKCGSDTSFTPLDPRQELTAAPYAHSLRPGAVVQNAATTGTTPAVTAETLSTTSGAIGLLGRVSATSPGAYSAGVRGINNSTTGSGIGVYGTQAGSGWGVYGYAPTGTGVFGSSEPGGRAIAAYNASASGVALEITQGEIKVNGAGDGTNTAVFKVVAVASGGGANRCMVNVLNDGVIINNSQANGDPNAILLVTQNAGTGGPAWQSGLGVIYDDGSLLSCSSGHWVVFRTDSVAIPGGARINVMVIKP